MENPLTKEEFTKVLTEEGMSVMDIRKLWNTKPTLLLDEKRLRHAAKRIAADRARGVRFL